LEIYCPVFAPI